MSVSIRFYFQCNVKLKHIDFNFIQRRCYSGDPKVKVPGKLKSYVTSSYLNYLNKFEDKFKRSLPGAHKLFRLFKDGLGGFFRDAKEYYGVSRGVWSGVPLNQFTCRQLLLYQQMPGDLIRSAPLIISIPVPLATYVVFPLAYYMYPQYLLCQHFWTDEQKVIFGTEDYESRLPHFSKILHYLESHSHQIDDSQTRTEFEKLLEQVKQAKEEIEPGDLLKFKNIFTTLPFGMKHLTDRHRIHIWHLCRGMDISTKVSKINQDLHLIRNMDLALHKEGIDSIKLTDLQQMGLSRGINPYEASLDTLKKYLDTWVRISMMLDESSYSLLLHCPVFLSPRWFKRTRI